MGLRKRLIEVVECSGFFVREVRIGLRYTAVQLDDGRTGVAFTFGRDNCKGCSAVTWRRPLSGRPALDLVRCLDSDNHIESAVALATINAISNVHTSRCVKGDVLSVVNLLPTDRVAMVGFFHPIFTELQHRVSELVVFDEHAPFYDNFKPAGEAVSIIPKCDVALITSTTIINNTLDSLLEAAKDCRETVLIGPSTPLAPEAFEGTSVTCLSGITIDQPDGILNVVSEGGGTRLFKPFVSKLNILLRW